MKLLTFAIFNCCLFCIGFASTIYPSSSTSVTELLQSTKTLTGQSLKYPCKTATAKEKVTIVKTTIAPGGNTGWHKHELPEIIYVNKGALTIKVVEHDHLHTYTLKAGDSAIEAINTIHRGENLGHTPVEIIAVFIGREDLANVTPVKLPRNIEQ